MTFDMESPGWLAMKEKYREYQPTPEEVRRAEIAQHINCRFRGDQLGEQQCETCSGVVMLKVFQCAVHGQCCIGKSPEGVQSCAACGEYVGRE